MTTMQCPLGHPPGPQQFCPICGRATVPVAEPEAPEAAESSAGSGDSAGSGGSAGEAPRPGPGPAVPPPPPPSQAGPPPQAPPPPAGPPPQAPPPPAAPSYEPTPPTAPPTSHGPAGDEARRLLEELSGGTPSSGSSWNVRPPIPSQDSGVFPSADIPSYAPQPPADTPQPPAPQPSAPLPAAPGSAYPNILPAEAAAADDDARPGRRERRDGDAPVDERPARSKVLPILLALAVLLGVFLLGKSLLGGDDEGDDDAFVRPSARASASAAASRPASKPATYTPAQIELALKDPHFKHGYDAGKAKAAAGAVSDPEATCREMGLAERTQGYPWGAHDRQGCLVGITS